MLNTFVYATYLIEYIALESGELPKYHGSMLRGLIGNVMRENHCLYGPESLCDSCLEKYNCEYNRLFNGEVNSIGKTNDIRPQKRINPFVIEAMQIGICEYKKNDSLFFRLTVFGEEATARFYQYIYALNQAESKGFGFQRIPFRLKTIKNEITQEKLDINKWMDPSSYQKDILKKIKYNKEQYIIINFISPTRIKVGGKYTTKPSFEEIMKTILRKSAMIASIYEYSYDYDYKSILEYAKKIEMFSIQTHWSDVQRYSSKKKQKISISGFTGKIVFKGDFTLFTDWIEFGRVVHIGKNATSGGGWFEYEYRMSP